MLDHCIVVNNDKEHIYAAGALDGTPLPSPPVTARRPRPPPAHTGLADTLMLAVSINVKKYPKASRFSGVHVSLHPPVRARVEGPG